MFESIVPKDIPVTDEGVHNYRQAEILLAKVCVRIYDWDAEVYGRVQLRDC